MDKSPDAFRTISEAAEELDLPQHVLRFWETRFTQIKPLKRGGGRRYYRPDDVQLLKGIRHLLYDQGFTIKGVQRILKEQGAKHVVAIGETGSIRPIAPQPQFEPATDEDAVDFVDIASDVSSDEPRLVAGPAARTEGLSARQKEELSAVLDMLASCKQALDKARG
ncbi:MerR family transcriptional regulator [Pelagibacterium sp. H642]|uniref:MerR family transcriptional regulator n=1 Tax=Pelagibacterium sp. H642 TaxID=1881069 RepID=UPI0028162CDB|nr:MerR family transcriptional regulator [Pelagibacterium sp. H642]WMT90768.1 MerR family transcriptional regulator [Pelagibacterium sp. H642]